MHRLMILVFKLCLSLILCTLTSQANGGSILPSSGTKAPRDGLKTKCMLCNSDSECSPPLCVDRRCVDKLDDIVMCTRNAHWECGDCQYDYECRRGFCRSNLCASNSDVLRKCKDMMRQLSPNFRRKRALVVASKEHGDPELDDQQRMNVSKMKSNLLSNTAGTKAVSGASREDAIDRMFGNQPGQEERGNRMVSSYIFKKEDGGSLEQSQWNIDRELIDQPGVQGSARDPNVWKVQGMAISVEESQALIGGVGEAQCTTSQVKHPTGNIAACVKDEIEKARTISFDQNYKMAEGHHAIWMQFEAALDQIDEPKVQTKEERLTEQSVHEEEGYGINGATIDDEEVEDHDEVFRDEDTYVDEEEDYDVEEYDLDEDDEVYRGREEQTKKFEDINESIIDDEEVEDDDELYGDEDAHDRDEEDYNGEDYDLDDDNEVIRGREEQAIKIDDTDESISDDEEAEDDDELYGAEDAHDNDEEDDDGEGYDLDDDPEIMRGREEEPQMIESKDDVENDPQRLV